MECDEYSNWRKNFSLFQLSPYLTRLITFLSEMILTFFSLHFIIVYILKYLWRKKKTHNNSWSHYVAVYQAK